MCGTSLVLLFSPKHESMLHLKNFCSRTKNNLFLGRKDEEMVIMALPGVVQVHTGGNQAMLIYMYISVSLLCLSQWENIFKARWEVHSYWEFIHDNATTSSAYYHHFSCTNWEKRFCDFETWFSVSFMLLQFGWLGSPLTPICMSVWFQREYLAWRHSIFSIVLSRLFGNWSRKKKPSV